MSKQKLVAAAKKKMKETNADIVIANDIGFRYRQDTSKNNIIIVDSEKITESGWKDKSKIARFIRNEIERRIIHN